MSRSSQQGFTLIEMIIVVAIISILTAIAYPMYEQHKLKSSRADAHSALAKAAQAQERYFNDNDTYAADVTMLRGITSNQTEHGFYTLTVECAGGDCRTGYTMVATPVGKQIEDTCYQLTLTSTGIQSYRSRDGSASQLKCW